ncbi:hypothetical protein B0H13DRAFT_1899420 [Mycena leptocephala]|nr:hypothetical protein B0H13DRAFT_1899420 [Mycena leptocephala]
MSNFETCSMNLAPAPKTPFSTKESTHKPLKRVVPAVEPKIIKNKNSGVRNRAAVSANAWPLPVLPAPGAAVSIVHGANVAAGHTWNRVSSNPPPLHLNWTFPSTCLLDDAGKLIQNPMQFVCERDAAPSFPTVAIDSGAFTSGKAISMPADPQVHRPSRGSLGWLPAVLRVPPLGPINVKAVQSPPLSILILATVFFLCFAQFATRSQRLHIFRLHLYFNPYVHIDTLVSAIAKLGSNSLWNNRTRSCAQRGNWKKIERYEQKYGGIRIILK